MQRIDEKNSGQLVTEWKRMPEYHFYTGTGAADTDVMNREKTGYGFSSEGAGQCAARGMKMDKIAVLIPCYNEAMTITKVVTDARAALPDAVVYVYDNNSTDDTARLAAEAGAVVRHEYMQGKGNVIRRMFREIDAQCYIMVDGDDTYPMEAAPEMADKVLHHNADMVVGDRLSSTYFTENKRPFHNMGNSLVRSAINHLFDCNIRDIMTGYRAFSYDFVKTFPVLSHGFEIETEMTIHAVDKNMFLRNVVVEYRDRKGDSQSKLNTYSDGWKVLMMIQRLFRTYRPMQYFGLAAAILMLIAVINLIPVVITYGKTGLVPRFPTLIACGFVGIAAVQAFFAGLMLKTSYQKNRQDFEMELYRATDAFQRKMREKNSEKEPLTEEKA